MTKTITIPMMNEIDQKHWAKVELLRQGDFIYYRAGRTDGRSGSYSLKKLNDALDHANEMRGYPELDASKEELEIYNIWTNISRFINFMKYNLPIVDDTEE